MTKNNDCFSVLNTQSRELLEYVLGHSSFEAHTFRLLLTEVKCIVGYLAILKSTQVMSDAHYLIK